MTPPSYMTGGAESVKKVDLKGVKKEGKKNKSRGNYLPRDWLGAESGRNGPRAPARLPILRNDEN